MEEPEPVIYRLNESGAVEPIPADEVDPAVRAMYNEHLYGPGQVPFPELLVPHAERAVALVGENLFQSPRTVTVAGASSEQLVSVAIVTAACIAEASSMQWHAWTGLLSEVLRRKPPFGLDDARLLFRIAEHGARSGHGLETLRVFLAAAQAAGPAELDDELERSFAIVDRETYHGAAEQARFRARIVKLRGSLAAPPLGKDDWAPRVRPLLDRPGSARLLAHLATATQSNPTARWRKQVGTPDAELVRALLEAAASTEVRLLREYEWDGRLWRELEFLATTNAVIVKGAVWAAGELQAEWATALLERIFRKAAPHNSALANACVNVLGQLDDPDAALVLSKLAATVKDRGYRKLIDRALLAAAARLGLSPSQLVERLVPEHGLDRAGRKELRVEDWTVRLEVEPARVRVVWIAPGGDERATAPKDLDATAAKAEIRELRKELALQRARLERLLAEGARWSLDDWRRCYLEHPLVGVLARRLLWRFDGEVRLGSEAPATAESVEVWHPIGADLAEVQRLRRLLTERELLQPFKQAFREVYVVAPAELETGVYSNRFAAHVLHYPQTYALLKERGWSGNALGGWDGGYEAIVARDFPAQGLRAEWYLEYAEDSGYSGSIGRLATTDQVRFHPRGPGLTEPVPLAEVPPLVFSEAMRDIDLFVGVSSIAADPTWADAGTDRWQDYWWRESFGELGVSARVRRDALEELVPRLAIADRLELSDRYLVVRGDLRTYKIHLGSGNILMEPNDQYLCIVPAAASFRPRSKVFLPFDDDARLNVIVSKAFLLARDARISDQTIRRQIRPAT